MKRSTLIQISQYLQKFKTISTIKRVDDTIIKIVFDADEVLFFDMRKGDAYVFKKAVYNRAKVYNAPFDVVLNKRFSRAKIEKIEVQENNRVLTIMTKASSSYKIQNTSLILEFTGKNTNCILVDETHHVIEALRHIDSSVSSRSVKVGETLEDLPPFEIKETPQIIDNMEEFLIEQYHTRATQRLQAMKNQRIKNIQKKIDKFQRILQQLENEESLIEKAQQYNFWGTLILSNLESIKNYQTHISLHDFEGNAVEITLPKEARNATEAANILFSSSKKFKKKAKSLYIERENLEEKIAFLQKMQHAIAHAKDAMELNILAPKQKQQKKSKNMPTSYESFYIEGFKIMLGKNEKGNIELLKEAKKRDIWIHMKDIPSSHVIIRTNKQNIPNNVLEFAAQLCVDFSVDKKGLYLVDYTQRRNVRINEGAHVNYVDYKTISVSKE
ncbi:NFACT RNA binding domain-containing protein [Sulfurospirillum sp. 1612]|uniref:NFACT RNA binding domain-containing protein n=1 Tax=Sulfurospirillum sp. 1612 TaxID=3094835 RepID=UPI002F93169A